MVYHLRDADTDAVSIDSLVEKLYSEIDQPPERLKTSLYHVHLLILADREIVEYDPRSKTVRYQTDTETERLLDVTESFEEKTDYLLA